jgi:hypothetical protein
MLHALTIAWAAVAVLVLASFSGSTWPKKKMLSTTAILLATALQACVAYYALGSDGVSKLLRLLGIAA